MTKTSTNKLSKAAAEKLWADIRTDLANVEKNLIRAIQTKSWVPLGYDSFVACWNDRLKGVRLATDVLKVHVVYALLDVSDDTAEVVNAIGVRGGVSPSTIGRIKSLRDQGMTVDEAVACGLRTPWGVSSDKPQSRPVIIPGLDLEVYESYRRIAGEFDSTLEKEAADALHAHFKRLTARLARRQQVAA